MNTINLLPFVANITSYEVKTVASDKDNAGSRYLVLGYLDSRVDPDWVQEDAEKHFTVFGLKDAFLDKIAKLATDGAPFPKQAINACTCEVETDITFVHLYQEDKEFKTGTKTVKGAPVKNGAGENDWRKSMKVSFINEPSIGVIQDPQDIARRMLTDPKLVLCKASDATDSTAVEAPKTA